VSGLSASRGFAHWYLGSEVALAPENLVFFKPAQDNIGLCRDLLVDFMGDPYSPAIQEAFRQGRLGLLSDAEMAQELRFQPGMLPNALVQSGPTLTAAAWQAQVGLFFLMVPFLTWDTLLQSGDNLVSSSGSWDDSQEVRLQVLPTSPQKCLSF